MTFVTHPFFIWKPKIWHLHFLVSKVSIAAFNIWLVALINSYFILLIIIMTQISTDIHVLGVNLNNKQPRIVYYSIQMQIMLKLLTEDGQLQLLFIILLALLSAINYISNQMWPLTPIMYNLYACTRLSRKLMLSGDTCNPYHSTLVHQ